MGGRQVAARRRLPFFPVVYCVRLMADACSVRDRVTRVCSTARSSVSMPISCRLSRVTPTFDRTCVGPATTAPARRHRRRSRAIRPSPAEPAVDVVRLPETTRTPVISVTTIRIKVQRQNSRPATIRCMRALVPRCYI